MSQTRDDLDAALLAAHAAGDKPALVELYRRAADGSVSEDAACFYLTHAYVFALETDHPDADALHRRLKAAGREE
ncbi:MAG: hypothetical protein AAFR17_01455 [Pseudomonadota bacterium]